MKQSTENARATPKVLEPLLTPEDVAKLLSCSGKVVYVWAERGLLPHVKLGRLVRFRAADVQGFIRAHWRGTPDLFSSRRPTAIG